MVDEPPPDPRAVLGVAADASADEIHAAYRRLSRSVHPDAGGSDDAFRRVRRAYEALTDGTSRVDEDELGDREDDADGDGDGEGTERRRSATGTATAAARRSASPAVAPSSPRSGCGVALVAVGVVLGLLGVVALIVLVGSSGPQSSTGRGRPGTAAPPETGPAAFARWRSDHEALVTAIVANGGDIGAALTTSSGTVDVDALQEACTRRVQLLDELERANPTPREDVSAAVRGFVASERVAMAACLSSPPDLDGLASAGGRGQADLRTLVQATRG